MVDQTERLGLPLIAAGQSQKEVTHNAMVAMLDMLAQPVVVARMSVPPAAPQIGQCWAVDQSPSGDWQGWYGAIAQWSANGWRFIPGFEGLLVWNQSDARALRFQAGRWSDAVEASALRVGRRQVVGAQQPGIAAPSGGTVVDAQARTTIASIITALQTHGLISQ